VVDGCLPHGRLLSALAPLFLILLIFLGYGKIAGVRQIFLRTRKFRWLGRQVRRWVCKLFEGLGKTREEKSQRIRRKDLISYSL
jgi:hypothetical protein